MTGSTPPSGTNGFVWCVWSTSSTSLSSDDGVQQDAREEQRVQQQGTPIEEQRAQEQDSIEGQRVQQQGTAADAEASRFKQLQLKKYSCNFRKCLERQDKTSSLLTRSWRPESTPP
ncbi:hypothetical protein GN244_ATG18593 [Phytophthora infestans]|uniref:Uncharacterized protein n=1 Tax=Phytophthora infestans TaxID=4787 RepID=A0A833S8E5_PHYIN|nr:hypothetical protein GN244_ATG18593 [Phytophthora infestans]